MYDWRRGNFALVGMGYSGHMAFANKPDKQQVAGSGPIPRGMYRTSLGIDHPRLGKQAIRLTPASASEVFGRSDFWVHGDNSKGDRSASRGCIILSRTARDWINAATRSDPEGADVFVVESVTFDRSKLSDQVS